LKSKYKKKKDWYYSILFVILIEYNYFLFN
jgi:hypothetical protein